MRSSIILDGPVVGGHRGPGHLGTGGAGEHHPLRHVVHRHLLHDAQVRGGAGRGVVERDRQLHVGRVVAVVPLPRRGEWMMGVGEGRPRQPRRTLGRGFLDERVVRSATKELEWNSSPQGGS